MVMELENQLSKFRYFAKQTMIELHWSLEDFDRADYYRLCEILQADGEQKVDAMTLIEGNFGK